MVRQGTQLRRALEAVGPKLLNHGSPILLVVVSEAIQRDRFLGSSIHLFIDPTCLCTDINTQHGTG